MLIEFPDSGEHTVLLESWEYHSDYFIMISVMLLFYRTIYSNCHFSSIVTWPPFFSRGFIEDEYFSGVEEKTDGIGWPIHYNSFRDGLFWRFEREAVRGTDIISLNCNYLIKLGIFPLGSLWSWLCSLAAKINQYQGCFICKWFIQIIVADCKPWTSWNHNLLSQK